MRSSKIIFIILILIFLSTISCNYNIAGTLGGGNTYRFNCNEEKLNYYLDSIEKYSPSLKTPKKWKKYDNWDATGYNFLKGKIFYIKGKEAKSDEMYYVTVIPPISKFDIYSGTAVRSIFRIFEDKLQWTLFEDLSEIERKEVEEKFQKKILYRIPLKIVSKDKK